MKFEALSDDHIKYAWAAYKRGVEMDFEPDLDAITFASQFIAAARLLEQQGTGMVVVHADTPRGNMPVGLITVQENDFLAYPHVIWYPEASPRNKIEIGVKFFRDLKKDRLGLVTALESDVSYFRHLGKYGLLRQVGKIRGFNRKGEDVILFQTV